MKKECEIVRDLLPNYIENLVGNQTKDFIETHIKECPECKSVLTNMQGNIIQEKNNDVLEEQAEIAQIKKYRRKMTILKVSVFTFILAILILIISFIAVYIPRYSIISDTYNKIQEIKNMNNYKFTMKQYYVDLNTGNKETFTDIYYYKDGTFKSESYSDETEKIINYGNIYDNNVLYINNNSNTSFNNTTYPYKEKGSIFNCFVDIENYMQNKLGIISLKVREDNYNNKNCYIIAFGNTNNDSRELWIDKELMLPIREIQKISNTVNFERTFLIEENIVSDSDITISNIKN